ncbi:MAG: spondin domain-containing protein [Granulosicoccus sp.]
MQFVTPLFNNEKSTNLVPYGLKSIALSTLLLLSACSDSDPAESVATDGEMAGTGENAGTPVNAPDAADGSTTQARYRLTFNATWSEATHPVNFPASAHFSGLVGAVHNEQVRFWEPAQIATPGIQRMAETGSKGTLLAEVQAAIDSGLALAEISGGGIGISPGSTSIEFDANRDYPQITVTSMLAPSPDWFVGLHNYSLLADDEFIDSATIELPLYDSGSDSGTQFTSGNEATDPLAPIATVSSDPMDTPFMNGTPTVGLFTLERLSVQ